MRLSLGIVLLGFCAGGVANSAVTNTGPDFKEVYDLVRGHLGTINEEQLNRAAVKGLVKALYPQVQLLGSTEETISSPSAITKSSLFEGDIAYLRVARVDNGLAPALRRAYEKLAATNKVRGLALDLRYASGQDYAAAVAVAELFVRKEQPLLDWGNGVVRTHEKSDAIAVPVAVLINAQTAGAAEALAASLREAAVALLLGNKTAGEALAGEEFPLKNGERLRIAASPVRLGDGTALSSVKPDIAVNVT